MSDSSTDEEKVAHGAEAEGSSSPEGKGENAADSPAAELNEDDNSTGSLDAIKGALGIGKEQSSGSGDDEGDSEASADSSKAAEKTPKAEEEEELGELTDEELNSYKPRTKRRIEGLLTQKKALEAELAEAMPAAERMRGLDQFVRDNGIAPDDVNSTFEILRLIHTDPLRAYEALTPVYRALAQMAGDVLPEDLKQQVDQGQTTEANARELARLRNATSFSESKTKAAREREAEESRTRETQQFANDAGKAVSDWETRWQANDPDYRHKVARVKDKIELEILRRQHQGNLPKNAREAVELAEKCKSEVDAEVKKLLPKKPAVKSLTGAGAANGSMPVASSSLEAMRQAIDR